MKKAIISNLHEKFSFLPEMLSGMCVDSYGSITLINSHLATDMFNIIYINDGCEPSEEDLIQCVNIFEKENLPFAFWMTDEESRKISEMLSRQGLSCTEEELAMMLNLADCPLQVNKNTSLIIKPIKDDGIMQDWLKVLCTLLPGECDAMTTFYLAASATIFECDSRIKCFVGYLQGMPVTTCSLFFSEKVAGIFDMITIPEAQRQGIATTMMIHALTEAKQAGYDYASLGASEEGAPVYKKLGFQNFGKLKIYTPKPEQ